MKENHFPTRERHGTHRPTIRSDETKKGAVTTVFFLKPFFLF